MIGEAIVALVRARRSLENDQPAVLRLIGTDDTRARSGAEVLGQRVGRAVARAARVVRPSTCLAQAVAGHALLARRGIPSRLCLGHDASATTAFSAHAWLEVNGMAVVGDASSWRFEANPK